ncbi:MAG TPA: hypothetical protein VFL47_00780, partial [Flavisolibacter sp.]|nr:hypothetical protein [Flavisolibacter sp.]
KKETSQAPQRRSSVNKLFSVKDRTGVIACPVFLFSALPIHPCQASLYPENSQSVSLARTGLLFRVDIAALS